MVLQDSCQLNNTIYRKPSGKHARNYIFKDGPVEKVDLPIKNGGFFCTYENIYALFVFFSILLFVYL